MTRDLELLLMTLDQAYDRKSWHGSNLTGALRGLTVEEAARRPGPGRPSIHEVVVHLAYWKYAVLRQLVDLPRGTFPLKGSNWFSREGAEADLWTSDRRLLDRMHRDVRAAVAALEPADLDRLSSKARYRIRDLVLGVAAHDLHHGGQIRLLRRLGEGG
jgi:uncharacterized damage-inducible protein DinB